MVVLVGAADTRARLVVKPVSADEVRVAQNALGAEIEVAHIVQDGRTYVVTSLKDGEEKTAKVMKAPPAIELVSLNARISAQAAEAIEGHLRTGQFLAKVTGPAFTPLGGLQLTDNDSRALVRGSFER